MWGGHWHRHHICLDQMTVTSLPVQNCTVSTDVVSYFTQQIIILPGVSWYKPIINSHLFNLLWVNCSSFLYLLLSWLQYPRKLNVSLVYPLLSSIRIICYFSPLTTLFLVILYITFQFGLAPPFWGLIMLCRLKYIQQSH